MKHPDFSSGSKFLLFLLLSVPAMAQVSVFTYHNDNARTGMNTNETILTPGNVNSNTFGKLYSYSVDGYVYAQPLYFSGLTVSGMGTHNVLFIATEHNSVYAFDADNNGPGGGLLWQTNLGISAVTPTTDFGTRNGPYNNIVPEVGISSTPVIDPVAGTIYVDVFTHEGTNYIHRVHALNVADGTERSNSPVVVAATYPGVGVGSSNGIITFVAKQQIQRSGLTLAGGVLYLTFAGYADTDPYHGWVIGYNANTLVQLTNYVFVTTPNSTGTHAGEGGLWSSGSGPSVDTDGNLLFPIGNGPFTATNDSGGTDFGDTYISLSTSNGLAVADYFTPNEQSYLATADLDIGSGGVLLLPDQPGPYPHLMVGVGKEGKMYLINRDQFTVGNNHYDSTNTVDYVVQTVTGQTGESWSTPTYFNGNIYFAGSASKLVAFALTNGVISATAVSTGPRSFAFPGATPIVSANGTNNGLVWALAYANPAVLAAYNPTNLTAEIYNSTQAPGNRDRLTNGIHFTLPTEANGKVFVGGQYLVSVFGLLNPSDNWRYAQFGDQATNSAVSGDYADPDSDGIVNLLEYALATDPNVPNTGSSIEGALSGNQVQIQFHRNTGATDLTYVVQSTDALNDTWTNMITYTRPTGWVANVAGTTAAESVTFGISPNQYVNVTVTDPTDLTTNPTNRFYRLNVHR